MSESPERWQQEQAELRSVAKAEGRVEGLTIGKAEGILAVLKARGLPISEQVRARVLGCQDLPVLDRWIVRAAVAASAAEVVAS